MARGRPRKQSDSPKPAQYRSAGIIIVGVVAVTIGAITGIALLGLGGRVVLAALPWVR